MQYFGEKKSSNQYRLPVCKPLPSKTTKEKCKTKVFWNGYREAILQYEVLIHYKS
jgi:hypothetical protein